MTRSQREEEEGGLKGSCWSETGTSNSDVEIASRTVQVENKIFHFDLKSNSGGKFLRITELSKGRRNTVIIPEGGIAGCREAIDDILRSLSG